MNRHRLLRAGLVIVAFAGCAVPATAQVYKVGSFTKSTGGAPVAQVIPHGLGQAPKALILWTDGKTSSAFSTDFLYAFGMTDGVTSNSVAAASRSNNALPVSSRRLANKALTIVQWGLTVLAEADLQSWDATNFTLNWTTNDANAYVVHFIAIGGSGVSAKVVNWTMGTAVGNKAVVGVGFTPDVVLHAHVGDGFTAAAPGNLAGAHVGLGVMDDTGGQWAEDIESVNALPSGTTRAQQTDSCLYGFNSARVATKKASFVSMDANGFTVNFTTANANAGQVVSLALKGLTAKAGSFLKSTIPSAPAFVAGQHAYNNLAPGITGTIALPNPSTTGDLVVVSFATDNVAATVSSVTDNIGNTYRLAVGPTTWDAGASKMYTYYASNIAAPPGQLVITITLSGGTTGFFDVYAVEYSGVVGSSPVDQTASAFGASLAATAGPVTTTSPDELIYASCMSAGVAVTANPPLTARDTTAGNFVADRTVAATGSYSVAGTQGVPLAWACQMVTFKGGQSVTGVGFPPGAVLLASFQDVAQANPVAQDRFGLGAADIASHQGSSAVADSDAVTPTSVQGIDKTTRAFMKVNNNASTVDAEAVLSNTFLNGFSLDWTTNDAVATQIDYLALGVMAAAPGCPAGKMPSGPSFVQHGTFDVVNGVGPAANGFTSSVPYNGDNSCPNDTAETIRSVAGFCAGVNVYQNPFPGDPIAGVPATGNYLYANGNSTGGPYIVWRQTVTGLTANSTYVFYLYASNANNPPALPTTLPTLRLCLGVTGAGPYGCATQLSGADYLLPNETAASGDYWTRFAVTFTTGAAQTTADLAILDTSVGTNGDDVAFTQVGVQACSATTAVTLQSFTASATSGEVDLAWSTASELSNLGFNVYRADAADGPYSRITASIIPGLGSSPTGQSYAYRDAGLVNGHAYYYELEDVDTTGRTTLHGPVSATPSSPVGAPAPPPSSAPGTVYGDPAGVLLHEIERDGTHVLLELLTPGFVATPLGDGHVRLAIPGFGSSSRTGEPDVPMRRALVEAVAGMQVRLTSVTAADVASYPGLRPAAAGAPGVTVTLDGSVVETHGSASESAAFSSVFPADWARLEGTVFQGETKKASLLLSPLRWDGSSLEMARRLVLRLEFAGRMAAETGFGGSHGRRAVSRGSHRRNGVVAQLVAKDRGLYRVDYLDVLSGRSEILATNLRLSRQGESVAFHVEPDPSRFGPGSSLFFLSEGSSLNPYGDAVYELETGSPGMLMSVERLVPESTPVAEEIATLDREENQYYEAGLLDAPDLWLWDLLVSPVSKSYPFTVDHVSSGSPAHVSVWFQGASAFPGAVDHHLRVRVNGVMVGEGTWSGMVPQTLDFEVGAGTLQEGQNTLDLENVGDTGAAYSMVFLDKFSLRYPRALVATQGTLEGGFTSSGQAAIDGLSSASFLLDTTETPRWLTGARATDTGLSFPVRGGRSYLATSTVRRPEVRRIQAGFLKDVTNRADYLLLAPRAFLAAAQPLLDRREREGLVTKAVPLDDVYEQFGHGETSPQAIKDFLEYAYQSWARPSPRYVLLLGDASYDPKDYLKTGVVNWLPGYSAKTSFMWTVSDPAYASVNGDDQVPDLAIGRLPASSAAEADLLVQKVLAFEDGGGDFGGTPVLVAGQSDVAGDFESDADDIAATTFAGRNPRKIYYSQEGPDTRADIEDAFDQGASFLSYVGHGGTVVWASENILNDWDVASLAPQSRQPFLMTMNCLNGFFWFPPMNSLAEQLLKADGKGAIAAFSPSGLSMNDAAHVYHKALLQEILSGNHPRLGDAILAAQEDYVATGNFPELLTIYHLFGDPALRIR